MKQSIGILLVAGLAIAYPNYYGPGSAVRNRYEKAKMAHELSVVEDGGEEVPDVPPLLLCV